MKCPKCGSENVRVENDITKRGFSGAKGCCGWIVMGPIGLLCGLCGKDKIKSEKKYWLCNNCGAKFYSGIDAEPLSAPSALCCSPENAEIARRNLLEVSKQYGFQNGLLSYGNHISKGNVVQIGERLIYSKDGVVEKISATRKKLLDLPSSFLSTDEKYLYLTHEQNWLAKLDPASGEIHNITTLNCGTDIHLFGDTFAFENISEGGLCLINKDGTNLRKITEDKVDDITQTDEWIYYINRSDKRAIYKIAHDGTQKIKLFGESKCENLMVDENYIYFVTNKQLKRLNEKTSEISTITENILSYIVTDKGIFWSKSEGLSFTPIDNLSQSHLLLPKTSAYHLSIVKEHLYFSTQGHFPDIVTHRYNLITGEIEGL